MCVETYPRRNPAFPAVVVIVVVLAAIAATEFPAIVAALGSVAVLADSLTRLSSWPTPETR